MVENEAFVYGRLITALPFVAIIAIAAIDALNKGRMMATVGWDDLPAFWRDKGWFAWRSVLALLVIVMCVGLWLVGGWRPAAALLVMAGCGVESVLYWWWLKPFGIKQPMFWKKSLWELHEEIAAIMDSVSGAPTSQGGGMPYETDGKSIGLSSRSDMARDAAAQVLVDAGAVIPFTGELSKEKPVAAWFCYPTEAPWLRILPPFWFGAITRGRVYITAWTGVLIAVGVML